MNKIASEIMKKYNIYSNDGVAYHVAETSVRQSIIQYGLDPYKYEDDITTDGSKVYVFIDKNYAIQYAKGYNEYLIHQGDSIRNFDIWEIDVRNMRLEKDYGLNSAENPEEDPAYCIIAPIKKEYLKLVKTI